MLTGYETERYSRQIRIPGWGAASQEMLRESSVFVAGAGGLGCPVIYYLAAAGVGRIIICDNDKIETSNLNRQILYAPSDSGKWKAETAAEKISYFNDNVNVKWFSDNLGMQHIDEIRKCNLIIDCLDNFDARHLLNRMSILTGIPMVHAGVSEYYAQMTFLHPGQTACLACFIPENMKKETAGITGAMAGIAGSVQALEALKYLTGTGDLLKNRILYIDGKTMGFTIINISKNPECKICSV
jgi:adenylyltransferase/sulfurtransferase